MIPELSADDDRNNFPETSVEYDDRSCETNSQYMYDQGRPDLL